MQKGIAISVFRYSIYYFAALIAFTICSGIPVFRKGIFHESISGVNSNYCKSPMKDKVEIKNEYDVLKYKIRIKVEGKEVNLTNPVLSRHNRYYLPVSDIIKILDGNIAVNENKIRMELLNNNTSIDLSIAAYTKDGRKYSMKKSPVIIENTIYITAFDFAEMFDLATHWCHDTSTLALYRDKDAKKKNITSSIDTNKKPALFRIEDIYPGNCYDTDVALSKLRFMIDYLYRNHVPFHVAWVPRFVDPPNGVDDDLTEAESMLNADFIFTLDYMMSRSGLLGLHGYTHQHGVEPSYKGYEFGDKINSTDRETRNRFEKAISTANKLDLPYTFFEFPHYSASKRQYKLCEEYFDYIYQPTPQYGGDSVVKKSIGSRVVRYIPTPLGYISDGKDVADMPKRIKELSNDGIASIYFHPFLEFEYINITKDDNGYPVYDYSEKSHLHKLLKIFDEQGYRFEKITNLK